MQVQPSDRRTPWRAIRGPTCGRWVARLHSGTVRRICVTAVRTDRYEEDRSRTDFGASSTLCVAHPVWQATHQRTSCAMMVRHEVSASPRGCAIQPGRHHSSLDSDSDQAGRPLRVNHRRGVLDVRRNLLEVQRPTLAP